MKSSAATTDVSPSAARRKALRQSTTTKTTILPTVPIKNYYALTDRLYASFSVALDNRELDHAYVWGIRFATFSTEALPKHPSYNGAAFAKLRKRNAQRTQQVLTQLEAVTARMDAEERLKEQQRQRLVQQQQEERKRELERQKREQEEAEEERKRLEILQQQQHKEQEKIRLEKSKIARQQAVQSSAMAKLASLRQQQPQKSASSDPPASRTSTNGAGTKISSDDNVTRMSTQGSAKREQTASTSPLNHTQSKAALKVAGPQQQQQQQQQQQHYHQSQQQRDDKTEISDFSPSKDLSKEEKQTLDLLQQTIARQEARIHDIVHRTIPAWRQQARAKLAAGQRKEALHCVYHKRRWQRTVDFLKESIFQMETQIMHIQSAAQDREVESVLQAAKDAMQAIHETTGLGKDSDAVENVMNEIGQGGLLPASMSDDALLGHGDDDDVDVEELLHEILSEEEESAGPAAASSTSAQASSTSSMDFASGLPADVLDLLALPSAPTDSKPTKEDASEKRELHKAVLG